MNQGLSCVNRQIGRPRAAAVGSKALKSLNDSVSVIEALLGIPKTARRLSIRYALERIVHLRITPHPNGVLKVEHRNNFSGFPQFLGLKKILSTHLQTGIFACLDNALDKDKLPLALLRPPVCIYEHFAILAISVPCQTSSF